MAPSNPCPIDHAKVSLVLHTLFPTNCDKNGSCRQENQWLEDDYICNGKIQDAMNHNLFDIYLNYQMTEKL